jgi:dipeptidyl aminopeptidase/acylaminoacyl peptidase
MKLTRGLLNLGKLGVVAAILVVACQGEEGYESIAKNPVTIADAIQMTRWADKDYFLGAGASDQVGLFSPDHTKFIVTIQRGNLLNNSNEYSILLFTAKHIFDKPAPELLVTMSSSSNQEAIRGARWLSDNRSIVFLGSNRGSLSQVYQLNSQTKRIERLTNHPTSIVAFDVSEDGHELVYEAVPPVKNVLNTEETDRNGVVITSQYPSDLVLAACASCERSARMDRDLYLQAKGRSPSKVTTQDFLTEYLPLSMSPNGRHVLLQAHLAEVPSRWSRYQDVGLHPYIVERHKYGIPSNVTTYLVVNTKTQELKPLIDAPVSWYEHGFAWAGDGSSIVLSGTYMPLDVKEPEELRLREQSTAVIEVSMDTRKIVKITDQPLTVKSWDEQTGVLLLEGGEGDKPHTVQRYQKDASGWKQVSAQSDQGKKQNLRVTLEENINIPPAIFVSDVTIGRKALIYDLNPQFKNLRFAKEESITWKASDGHESRGGIYIPPDYKPGSRYPLVIQTHGYNKERFWIDGPWDSAFAAQALANCGIFVVQTDEVTSREEYKKFFGTGQEGRHEMSMYEGLIDELDKRGMIDREKVGVIGFSRTVYHTAYTLTHSKYDFAAATMADGFDGGYVNYALFQSSDSLRVNGGTPFGGSLLSWMNNAPGFNLEKVKTPVRIEMYGPGMFLGGWEWFSGLSLLNKPVDFVWLPNGTHLLVKPWERMTSEQGNVDWFRFWLQGYEDPDPEKKQQYVRWRHLRDLQDTEDKASAQTPARVSKPN